MNFWNKSFSPVFMAIRLGLLAWLILGHVTALLIICCLFLVMLIAHAVQLTQLQKFLENPSILKQQPRPLGWKRIFDDIKTALPIPGPNKEETHHRLQSARAVGDAISDIMIIVGKEFELIWCNRAAEKALQINRKNDVGHKIVEKIRHKEFQKYNVHNGIIL